MTRVEISYVYAKDVKSAGPRQSQETCASTWIESIKYDFFSVEAPPRDSCGNLIRLRKRNRSEYDNDEIS